MPERILRLPEVKTVTGLSRSAIYLYMEESNFPRQVKLGKRAVGWRASEIAEWTKSRISVEGRRHE